MKHEIRSEEKAKETLNSVVLGWDTITGLRRLSLAYDVHSSFDFLPVFVERVDHHHRGLDRVLLEPLTVTTQNMFCQQSSAVTV